MGYRPDIGPTPTAFATRFRARHGVEPDYPAAQAYAAGLVAQRCIEATGTLQNEPLRDAANQLVLTTLYGHFKLDAMTSVQIGHQLVVVQWQAGQKRIVWPEAVAQASPQLLP